MSAPESFSGASHPSPLLDNVVQLIAGFVVFQAFHRIPLALAICLAQLADKHLEGDKFQRDHVLQLLTTQFISQPAAH